jgi:regulator of replication initiation timing
MLQTIESREALRSKVYKQDTLNEQICQTERAIERMRMWIGQRVTTNTTAPTINSKPLANALGEPTQQEFRKEAQAKANTLNSIPIAESLTNLNPKSPPKRHPENFANIANQLLQSAPEYSCLIRNLAKEYEHLVEIHEATLDYVDTQVNNLQYTAHHSVKITTKPLEYQRGQLFGAVVLTYNRVKMMTASWELIMKRSIMDYFALQNLKHCLSHHQFLS